MSDPFIGEIRIFAGNFAPRDWAFCDGSLVLISQNTSLFSILGTTYGGDGRSNFALPDLRGRIPVHAGQGTGLSNYRLGQKGGSETVTLELADLASHSHQMQAINVVGDVDEPQGNSLAQAVYTTDTSSMTALNGESVSPTGGGGQHDNMAPTLSVNFIVALSGTYPSRS